MKNLELTGTESVPTIYFNANTGRLLIEGVSIPENVMAIYGPMNDWLIEYSLNPRTETHVEIKFKYYNTSSSKGLHYFFKTLESMYKKGNQVLVTWYYQKYDLDIFESGKDFSCLVNIPFNLVAIK